MIANSGRWRSAAGLRRLVRDRAPGGPIRDPPGDGQDNEKCPDRRQPSHADCLRKQGRTVVPRAGLDGEKNEHGGE